MISKSDFKDIVEKNKSISQKDAESIIIPILKKIPVPETTVNKNTFIERAVPIDKSKAPFNVSRLSYIPNDKKSLAKQGRFNCASESMFYGAFTDLDNPELTRYFLACEIEQDLFNKSEITFKFTTSKWLTIDSFTAILFIFDEKYCGSDLIKEAYEEFQKDKIYKSLDEGDKEILKLITIQLAKPKQLDEYAISNVIFDFYKEKGYGAIIYPGVQSQYKGNNIAMIPDYVDKYLTFYKGAEFELIKKGSKIQIDNKYGLKEVDSNLEYFEFKPEELGKSKQFPT